MISCIVSKLIYPTNMLKYHLVTIILVSLYTLQTFSPVVYTLDTETTGLSPYTDRIASIACINIETGETFSRYVNPQCEMSPYAFKVNNLSTAFLSTQPTFEEIADDFLQFIGDGTLVAHNATFDINFINAELERLGKTPLANTIIDTLKFSRSLFPKKTNPEQKHTLDALCALFNISTEQRKEQGHGALIDAQLLIQVYKGLLSVSDVTSSTGNVTTNTSNATNPTITTALTAQSTTATDESNTFTYTAATFAPQFTPMSALSNAEGFSYTNANHASTSFSCTDADSSPAVNRSFPFATPIAAISIADSPFHTPTSERAPDMQASAISLERALSLRLSSELSSLQLDPYNKSPYVKQ